MTKQECIERYGIEWYEAHKARNNARNKERYANNSEFREIRKYNSREYHKERYNNDTEYHDRINTRNKERYANNSEFREIRKVYHKEYHKDHYANDNEYHDKQKLYRKASYVKDGRIDLIENYDKAKVDNFEDWEIHHRLELHPDYSLRFTKESLIKLGLYYNRLPNELIWLTKSEHRRMHALSKYN
jgi:hypothetical protein